MVEAEEPEAQVVLVEPEAEQADHLVLMAVELAEELGAEEAPEEPEALGNLA